MAAADEDALTCDFAEFYGVLDWRKLPLRLAATLAAGLSENSRSKRQLSGRTAPLEHVLLAAIADNLHTLIRVQLARSGIEMDPAPSILRALTGSPDDDAETLGFEDSAALQSALYPETGSAFEEVS